MTRTVCAVPGCMATRPDYQLFHTPKDPDLSWRWKKVVGSKETIQEWKHALICEQHFDPATSFEQYQKGKYMGKRKLVKGALPTLNLPEAAVLAEIHNYAIPKGQTESRVESYQSDPLTEPDFDDVIAPEKKELNKAALDAELAKAVAKGLVTKSMTQAKKRSILSRQDLVEKEAIKQLRAKILKLKEEKKQLQKESSNLDIKLRKLNKRSKTLTEKEKEEFVERVLSKHFSKAQIRCFVRGNWQMSKLWEERDYKLALIIHTISKRCFHYLRNHQVLPMPSHTSLKKHTFDEATDVKTVDDVDMLIANEFVSEGPAGDIEHQMVVLEDGQYATVHAAEHIQVEGGMEGQTAAIQLEGTQIHIDGQSYTVEGQPFTLDGQQIQIAEAGGQIITTADGQLKIAESGQVITTADGQLKIAESGQLVTTADGQLKIAESGQLVTTADGQLKIAEVISTADGQIPEGSTIVDGTQIVTAEGQVMTAAEGGGHTQFVTADGQIVESAKLQIAEGSTQFVTADGQIVKADRLKIGEGGGHQFVTADGQIITAEGAILGGAGQEGEEGQEAGGITVMNVVDASQLEELKVGQMEDGATSDATPNATTVIVTAASDAPPAAAGTITTSQQQEVHLDPNSQQQVQYYIA